MTSYPGQESQSAQSPRGERSKFVGSRRKHGIRQVSGFCESLQLEEQSHLRNRRPEHLVRVDRQIARPACRRECGSLRRRTPLELSRSLENERQCLVGIRARGECIDPFQNDCPQLVPIARDRRLGGRGPRAGSRMEQVGERPRDECQGVMLE